MKRIFALSLLIAVPSILCTDHRAVARSARKADYPINSIFVERWSPRAMSGESVSDAQLEKLFEAARWAPSSYNNQPWRFIFARKKNAVQWQQFTDLLVDFNKQWCANASVLVVLVSHTKFAHNNEPCSSHSLDAGAAWQNLALQGSIDGLVVHGMGGFDADRARTLLKIPADYAIEMMIAIGHPAEVDVLPEEMRSYETPSSRKKVAEIAFEGVFQKS